MNKKTQNKSNTELQARIKYGIIIGIYTFIILVIGILMYCCQLNMPNLLENDNHWDYLYTTFGLIFFFSTIWLVYFAAKEIVINFTKTTKFKKLLSINVIIAATVTISLATLIGPLFIYLVHNENLVNYVKNYKIILFAITITIFVLTPILSYVWFYLQTKNWKKTFVASSLTFLIIGFFFSLYYNAYCATWYNIFFLIISCVLIDMFAYFGGTKFGKHKMCPTISPNKTWEGFLIGYGSTIVILLIICLTIFFLGKNVHSLYDKFGFLTYGLCGSSYQVNLDNNLVPELPCLIILIITIPLVGCAGDLLFSKYKRIIEIKDFSNWIPGHGGLLDRIDSWSLAFVSFTFINLLISLIAHADDPHLLTNNPFNGMWSMIPFNYLGIFIII